MLRLLGLRFCSAGSENLFRILEPGEGRFAGWFCGYSRFNKQRNLHRTLVSGSRKSRKSPQEPGRIFEVYIEASTEFIPPYLPDGLSHTLFPQSRALEIAPSVGMMAERTFQGLERVRSLQLPGSRFKSTSGNILSLTSSTSVSYDFKLIEPEDKYVVSYSTEAGVKKNVFVGFQNKLQVSGLQQLQKKE